MFYLFQENIEQAATPAAYGVESAIAAAVQWLKLGVETIGAIIICIGVALSIYQFAKAFLDRETDTYNGIRLNLARYLALALEFQLGADILSTAVAPSWEQIGKLGAIAVIRTGLNYFLMREMELEKQRIGNPDEITQTEPIHN